MLCSVIVTRLTLSALTSRRNCRRVGDARARLLVRERRGDPVVDDQQRDEDRPQAPAAHWRRGGGAPRPSAPGLTLPAGLVLLAPGARGTAGAISSRAPAAWALVRMARDPTSRPDACRPRRSVARGRAEVLARELRDEARAGAARIGVRQRVAVEAERDPRPADEGAVAAQLHAAGSRSARASRRCRSSCSRRSCPSEYAIRRPW